MSMTQRLAGKVAVVTGAGDGLGRAEALELAAAGAAVVVNDVGSGAQEVVEEILGRGGAAAACVGDISLGSTGAAIMTTALGQFGSLDIVVNNAGVVRDRMVFNMTEDEWDRVIDVHLRGHFIMTRLATAHWREASRAQGGPVYGRIVNTASEAAFNGGPGQPNYAAAKSGIIALTISTARGCARYGVTANAICPRARTAMTEGVFGEVPSEGLDLLSVDQVVPLVTYLGAPEAEGISGQVFVVHSGKVVLMAPPSIEATFESDATWTADEIHRSLGNYFEGRDPAKMFSSKAVLDRV